MRITVKSDHGLIRFRDDTATVGETTLNDMFDALADLMRSLRVESDADESIVLPFGFTGAEVAPTDDD